MNALYSILFASLAIGLPNGLSSAAAETTNAPASRSLDAFKIITERNIFNANRRLRSAEAPAAKAPRPDRIESFSLVGTMADGGYAFFEGTEPSYKKVLKPGDSIAGYKILEVQQNCVKLEGSEGKVELPVQMQMRKRNDEKWQVIAGTGSTSSSSSSSPDSGRRERNGEPGGRRDRNADSGRRDRGFDRRSAAPNSERSARPASGSETKPAEESTSGDSPSDILQKMMQRRAQETNR